MVRQEGSCRQSWPLPTIKALQFTGNQQTDQSLRLSYLVRTRLVEALSLPVDIVKLLFSGGEFRNEAETAVFFPNSVKYAGTSIDGATEASSRHRTGPPLPYQQPLRMQAKQPGEAALSRHHRL